MQQSDIGILFAWHLDRDGAAALAAGDVDGRIPDQGTLWVHLDRTHAGVRRWLLEEAGLDEMVVDALLAEETRPHIMRHGDGLLVNLRGVNLNPGADPEDMVSVRLWLDSGRVISMRGRRLLAADDVSARLTAGRGPRTSGGVLAALAEALAERMRPVVDGIEDAFDIFEEALIDDSIENPSATTVSAMRRRAIELRRYLAPQRDVMAQLAQRDVMAQLAPMGDEWLDGDERLRLRYTADSIMRLVEDLDAARERGAVTHEELRERLSQQINRNMYLLSVVAAIFLPLSFLTGLLGINVGGIPGAEAGWAFLAVCIGLVVLLAAEIWFLRRRQWLD